MSIWGGFSESGPGVRRVSLVKVLAMAAVGLGMFWLSFRYVLPNDLFTSALFFDALGLQPVFATPAGAFSAGGIWPELPDVTTEAFVFSLSLLVIQIFLGYRASVAGDYTAKSSNLVSLFTNLIFGREKMGRGALNWSKVGWVAFYWVIAMLDTVTDAAYRAWFGEGKNVGFVFVAFIISFFYYSMASEWMIVVGSTTAIDYIVMAFSKIKEGAAHAVPLPHIDNGGGNNSRRNRNR